MAGAAALLFYLLFYTLMTLAAFAVLIAVGREGERDVTLDDLSGLGESRPGLALMMTVSMLALLGFPGTAGFIGKWYILVSATGAGYTWLAAVLVLTTVLSAGYYLPIIMAMYMKPRLHDRVHERVVLPAAARRVVAVATVALVLFGFWPNLVMDAARDASHSFRPAHVTGFAGSVAPR
jgi:NADH-quinone oxidoreductase subunit N